MDGAATSSAATQRTQATWSRKLPGSDRMLPSLLRLPDLSEADPELFAEALEHRALFSRHNQHGLSLFSRATGATRAVHVGERGARQLVVQDPRHIGYIDTSH